MLRLFDGYCAGSPKFSWRCLRQSLACRAGTTSRPSCRVRRRLQGQRNLVPSQSSFSQLGFRGTTSSPCGINKTGSPSRVCDSFFVVYTGWFRNGTHRLCDVAITVCSVTGGAIYFFSGTILSPKGIKVPFWFLFLRILTPCPFIYCKVWFSRA